MTIEKFVWADFSKKDNSNEYIIKTAEDLDNYIKLRKGKENQATSKYEKNRAYYHDSFFHYTNLKNIETILDEKSFLCTELGLSNDPLEKIEDNLKHKVFHLCFSTGVSENIPLWYLYAGVDGNGGCLRLTKSLIYELMNCENFSFVYSKKDTNDWIFSCNLIPKVDFEIKLQDVIYETEDNDSYRLKYNTMQRTIQKNEFDKFKKINTHFIKSLVWYYEKETRILIKLTNIGFEKIPDCIIDENNKFAVRIDFTSNFAEKMQLKLGPQFSVNEEGDKISNYKILEKLEKYPNIFKKISKGIESSKSHLTGQVKMTLCRNCTKEK